MEEIDFNIRFLSDSIPASYIKTPVKASLCISELLKKDCLFGLDTETKGKDAFKDRSDAALSPLLGRVRLLQIYDGKRSYLFDIDYTGTEIFKEFLETKRFIAHNALFDLGMIKTTFGVNSINLGCTFIAAKLIIHEKYPTDTGLSASLSGVVKLVFKEDILKHLQASDWGKDELTFEQIEYAALDPICVLKIAQKFAKTLHDKKLLKIYQLYKDSQAPIIEMQLAGIGFDTIKHNLLIEKWRKNLLIARKKALDFTGLSEITSHKVSEWLQDNLPVEVLNDWPKTPGGKLSTNKDTFKQHEDIESLKPLLEFSKYETLLSTFGTSLLNYISPVTGRLHPNYNIAGARTGRLSSSKPNIQNQPSKRTEKEFKNIFIPHPGNVIVCADFSQIEVRIAAEISGDELMKSVYRRGGDIYKETAARVLNKPIDEVTELERQQQKAVILGRLFGLGPIKFIHYAKSNYGINVSLEEATKFITEFKEVYPVFTEWQRRQSLECKNTLKAKTIYGKIRALDKDAYYGMSLNTPVQGSAAEVILCSLNRFYKEKEKCSLLIACVHDEIAVETPLERTESTKELLVSCMVKGYLDLFPQGVITKLVEAKVGVTWGEAK